ncbi:hypothetical protein KAFR_0A06760 [Kazachstania africana CBS 2517]|uniref:Non-structural maintenance of chromosomes element 4 n=1 Tax=Kazachstania africana (strain ATCC 22294 / BCRC 22015 / CBS 2517 / CECT 1963 / NBRC 1671 / NRRL Y-8276) TaxID=1071382 RepID=H2AP11_KAZAF|nr:hypothetical protein KAFR_0A06760 [Kazachstania africana CBS 2517]CCF56111.1 hypothetical protein KAFR_0A06760 [Kazachstania africana CBS 2517]
MSLKRSHPEEEDVEQSGNEYGGIDVFGALNEYRKMQLELAKDRAKAIKDGDIGTVVDRLEQVDKLFDVVKGKSDNVLLASDAKTLVSINELAEMNVRNLKLGENKSTLAIDDMMGYLKKFLLKEYFDLNQITLADTQGSLEDSNEDGNENEKEDGDSRRQDVATAIGERFKESTIRKNYLSQFQRYDEFPQFNWFRLGTLYTNVSKSISATDHLLGPFSLEKKVRTINKKPRVIENIGEMTRAEKVTRNDLNQDQNVTTPEQVKKCFKQLNKKIGVDGRISLFEFIINPTSFAKSVENLFYTSFLIKENRIMLEPDEEQGVPYIRIRPVDKAKKVNNSNQNHIIFQLDMPTWEKLKLKFNITKSFLE